MDGFINIGGERHFWSNGRLLRDSAPSITK
jgi:hypothetical protein